jgi:hypothetical protein
MNKEKLFEIRSNWILPNGDIFVVPSERHDDYLPDGFATVEQAEKKCVKMSCAWGYTAPISAIYLPDVITTQQAQTLVGIEESLVEAAKDDKHYGSMKEKIEGINYIGWNEILDLK